MAQPVIVAAATTAGGMALGPSEDHGMRPYSRTAGRVKIVLEYMRPRAARFADESRDRWLAILGSRVALGSPAIAEATAIEPILRGPREEAWRAQPVSARYPALAAA